MLFSRQTGSIIWTRFNPNYDADGVLRGAEPIPFRLTRNLQFFLTSVGVEGGFTGTMCAVACALTRERVHLQQYLTLLLRDELSAHQKQEETVESAKTERRSRLGASARAYEPPKGPMSPKEAADALQLSVENVLHKLQTIAPAPVCCKCLVSLCVHLMPVCATQSSMPSASRAGTTINSEARITGMKVAELIATATSVNVCLMPPTWHPWCA